VGKTSKPKGARPTKGKTSTNASGESSGYIPQSIERAQQHVELAEHYSWMQSEQ
jgi:hypothetical protein